MSHVTHAGFVTFDGSAPVDKIMHRRDHVIKGKEVMLYLHVKYAHTCRYIHVFLFICDMCKCS